MRKLILIFAVLLASASAQAGQSRGLSLASSDEQAKPIAQVSIQLAQAATAPAEASAPAHVQAPAPAQTPAATATTTESKPETRITESKPANPVKKVRRETDEQKARRIAAKYGVYW